MEKNYLRKTKIVCTLGPSTDSEETLTALINAGMNVGRFNFSHGEHKEQEDRLALLKKVREQMQAPIAAMDLRFVSASSRKARLFSRKVRNSL